MIEKYDPLTSTQVLKLSLLVGFAYVRTKQYNFLLQTSSFLRKKMFSYAPEWFISTSRIL